MRMLPDGKAARNFLFYREHPPHTRNPGRVSRQIFPQPGPATRPSQTRRPQRSHGVTETGHLPGPASNKPAGANAPIYMALSSSGTTPTPARRLTRSWWTFLRPTRNEQT